MTDSSRNVDAIAEDYVEAYAAQDPFTATFAGIPGHDAETTDLSPAGFAERVELARSARFVNWKPPLRGTSGSGWPVRPCRSG